jgi:hypothetical protein
MLAFSKYGVVWRAAELEKCNRGMQVQGLYVTRTPRKRLLTVMYLHCYRDFCFCSCILRDDRHCLVRVAGPSPRISQTETQITKITWVVQ